MKKLLRLLKEPQPRKSKNYMPKLKLQRNEQLKRQQRQKRRQLRNKQHSKQQERPTSRS